MPGIWAQHLHISCCPTDGKVRILSPLFLPGNLQGMDHKKRVIDVQGDPGRGCLGEQMLQETWAFPGSSALVQNAWKVPLASIVFPQFRAGSLISYSHA